MSPTRDLVIGVDSSTTACKAIAWNRAGQPVAESRAIYPMHSPQPNWYEQRADDWWDALCTVLRGLTTQVSADRIAAVCITNQRETFVPVDEAGDPIHNALLWLDLRARPQVAELDERIGLDALHSLTGKGPAATSGLPKLLWLHKYAPEVVERTHLFLEAHAFLVHRLTGRFATSLACADPLGLVDMARGTWAADMLATLGIDAGKLPEIIAAGSVVGAVTAQAAEQTHLPVGLPVIAGAGDGQCAGLGANITAPNRAYMNLGTAMVSGAHSDRYVTSRAFRTLCSPITGAYVPEECLSSGTFIVSWFVEQFGPDVRGLNLPLSAEELLEAAAAKVPPGALGLMLVPYWSGVLSPYWDPAATGIMVGWTAAHRREHFFRAIMEGIAYEERLSLDNISAATGQPIDDLILMGGGARSAVWCQIVADIVGRPVRRAGTPEATSLGAAILAAAAVGWYSDVRAAAASMTSTERIFTPDAKTVETYAKLYEIYRELYPALQPHLRRLTELTTTPESDLKRPVG
jgi:xylulokinase